MDCIANRFLKTICVDWSNTLRGTNHLDAEFDLTKELPFADASFDSNIVGYNLKFHGTVRYG